MNSTARFSVKHAFVLDESVSSKIWSVLQTNIGEVYVSAACSDDLVRRFEGPDELHSYENPLKRAISALSYFAGTSRSDASASVRFNWRGDDIGVEIDGREATVLKVRDSVHDILSGTRAWYWRISAFSPYAFFAVVAVLAIWILNFMAEGKKSGPLPFKGAALVAIVMAMLLGLATLVPWFVDRLKRRYFPHAVFAFGQGRVRYETTEKIRWGVVVAFIVSFVASIVAAIRVGSS